MNTPNRRGRTVARQLIPKAIRRRNKRALKKTAKAPERIKRVKPSRQKWVLSDGARIQKIRKPAKPAQKRAAKVRAQRTKLIAVKRYQKRKIRTVPKSKTAAKSAKQSQQKPRQAAIILFRKPSEAPQQKRPLELPARAESLMLPSQKPPRQEPPKRKAEKEPLDYLEDGVVEWGIRREEE